MAMKLVNRRSISLAAAAGFKRFIQLKKRESKSRI
jgi:hypothetical protein